MDIATFLILLAVPLIASIAALFVSMKSVGGYLLAIFAGMMGIVDIYFFLGLGQDGDITNAAGTPIVSPTINLFIWDAVTFLILGLGLLSFMSALFRVYEVLSN